MAHRYSPAKIESMIAKLIEVQRKKGLYVTMQEVTEALGYASTSAASYAMNALLSMGKVEKIRNHYHVKETTPDQAGP